MKTLIASSIVAGMMLTACGGEVQEAAEGLSNLQKIAESADEMQKSADIAQKRMGERRAKGDTLAMPYEQLGAYLVDVSGMTAEPVSGESVSTVMGSWSHAKRTYTSGGKSFNVELSDYNGATGGYAAATAIFALNMSSDSPEKKTGTFQTGDPMINGYAEYYKKEQRSSVTWGIGSRFLLVINADGVSSSDEVLSFAKQFDLKKLSAM